MPDVVAEEALRYRWFKTRGVPIRDSEGGIFKWFGACTGTFPGPLYC
jgi:hypothetical protein